ncbi:MAG TPA: hypothetical protein VK788_04600 [Terriglobales bacterium]|nr:hypothetical protein [Terriglobales bacterium]
MSATTAAASRATQSGDASTPNTPQSVRTRYFNVYRLAAYILVLYAFGHTLGAVIETPKFSPESDAVISMMKSVHVIAQGADRTWYGFYRGFGWFVSVFFVFSIVILWHLGARTARDRAGLAPIAWSLFLSHAAGSIIAWVYFFPVPIIFSTVITMLVGVGCIQDWNAGHKLSSGVAINRPYENERISKEDSNG